MKFRAGIILALFLFSVPAMATNFTVEGEMSSKILCEINRNIAVEPGVQSVTLSYIIPGSFKSSTVKQDIKGFNLTFSPEPTVKTTKTDKRGAWMIVATWQNPPESIDVSMNFEASNLTELKKITTDAVYPVEKIPSDALDYLKPTKLIQSDDPRILRIARELTEDASTEFDAVQHIISWVVDHVRYVTPPQAYDALYSLESGMGNCQNYSHLSAALMRAAGIPVRIINGITLKKPYDVNNRKGVLTLRMGQGRHSWNEVWFPDLGWVPFDPSQTALFVSNRYLRIEAGSDNDETINDGRLRWTQTQGKKGKIRSREGINADFSGDKIKIKGIPERYGPRNLLMCPPITAEFRRVELEEAMAEVFPPIVMTSGEPLESTPEQPPVEVATAPPEPPPAKPAPAVPAPASPPPAPPAPVAVSPLPPSVAPSAPPVVVASAPVQPAPAKPPTAPPAPPVKPPAPPVTIATAPIEPARPEPVKPVAVSQTSTPPAPVKMPPAQVAVQMPAAPAPPKPVTFGNLLFPENIDFAFPPATITTTNNREFEQVRDFYVETAEYVSSKLTQYAQIFIVKKPVTLQSIGLALHRFGGQGTLWIDLYRDENGTPGERIATSDMVDAEALSLRPGYRWQDFPFAGDVVVLEPGSYWIGLGYTGDPIINWYFTYGKPVGPFHGTRYKGVYEKNWSGAMAYEFNYRVTGITR